MPGISPGPRCRWMGGFWRLEDGRCGGDPWLDRLAARSPVPTPHPLRGGRGRPGAARGDAPVRHGRALLRRRDARGHGRDAQAEPGRCSRPAHWGSPRRASTGTSTRPGTWCRARKRPARARPAQSVLGTIIGNRDQPLETHKQFAADKRPGEKCGLGTALGEAPVETARGIKYVFVWTADTMPSIGRGAEYV